MSRKFKVWLSSGANHASTYRTTVTLDEVGLTDEDFDAMSDQDKDDFFREIAFERSDWGWSEIE